MSGSAIPEEGAAEAAGGGEVVDGAGQVGEVASRSLVETGTGNAPPPC